jgi:hypothetical protein
MTIPLVDKKSPAHVRGFFYSIDRLRRYGTLPPSFGEAAAKQTERGLPLL